MISIASQIEPKMGTAALIHAPSSSSSKSQFPKQESESPTAHSRIHALFPSSPFFSFEALRILSTAPAGGCDPAEFMTAIAAIKPNDPISWHLAWAHAAALAERIAEEAERIGDTVAAREGWLRASSYTRASGYMFINGAGLENHDERAVGIARKVQTLFRRACRLLDADVRVLEIPYTDEIGTQTGGKGKEFRLPAYLYIPSENRLTSGKIPVLINTGGADSVQEELYFIHPQAGHLAGYAVLTFEGPGQGIVLRETGSLMRPDWEIVIGRVLDWLEGYAIQLKETGIELDLERIAIVGASMGGYYALRAASDSRIKACVAVDPFYDMWDFGTKHISRTFIGAWTDGWVGDGFVDWMIWAGMKAAFQLRWEVGVTTAFWGIERPSQILKEMKRYSLKGGFLEKVKCPVFVTGAGKSIYFDTEEHTMRVLRDLEHLGEKNLKLWMPNKPEEGGLQAKMGAFGLANLKVFGFLDEVFGIKRVIVEE
jgi:pimeloyl-ACP methyl ester carboxylesterase